MSELNIEKLISDYLDSVYVISHSQASVDCYKFALNHFTKFVQSKYEKSLEQILTLMKDDSIDRYKIFQEYVIYLDKEGMKPSSIKMFVIAPKGFVKYCGIKLYNEDFKMTVKLPKRIRQREEPLTKEIILRLLNNVSAKLRTIILVTSSSGMRIGETIQLKLSDIDFDSKPTLIRIRGVTTKTQESRETFLTTEATNSLKDYLTRYFNWKENEPNNLQDLVILVVLNVVSVN